jgi:endonuclease/exonuclease/phosphatase family metal-dependent hydrolase
LLWCNCIFLAALLLSVWLPYLSPADWWPSGFAGLLFPVFFCINLLFIPIWLFYKKRYYWLSIAGILLSYKAVMVSFAPHWPQPFSAAGAQAPGFTLMTFNTSSMGLKGYEQDEDLRSSIYHTLREASPDILCLQEFYTNDNPKFPDNIHYIRQKLGYPYHYFTADKTQWDTWRWGIALFSRHPVIRAEKIPCGHSAAGSGSSILQADVLVHGDTIRVLTAQLQSYMLGAGGARGLRPLLYKMRSTFPERARQATQLLSLASASHYPVIVCGDLNDTPVSYTYYTLSRSLQDAFLHKGSGIGRTLSFLSPTLRIDYILTNSHFDVQSYHTFGNAVFEHFPVMASLSLKK